MSTRRYPNWGNNTFFNSTTCNVPWPDHSNAEAWAEFPAISNVNMNNCNIYNVHMINGNQFFDASQWSRFEAIQDVSMNNKSIYNANNVNVKGFFRVEGNASSPYWNEIKLDGNITTANNTTLYPPTNEQYFSSYRVDGQVFSPIGLFPGAAQTTTFQMGKGGVILPLGDVKLKANNAILYEPFVSPPYSYAMGTYRGYAFFGIDNCSPTAYIRMNYDTLGNFIPNNSALIEINADSVTGITELASSRVRTTAGKCDMLGTYGATLTAGTYINSLEPNLNNNYTATCKVNLYSYDGVNGIPNPSGFDAGVIDINCSSKNTKTGFNFGNSVINIEAERYSGTSPFSATVNIKANDKINVNAYRTQIDTYELRLGSTGGSGCHVQCDGLLEFHGNVKFDAQADFLNLNSATGAYPAYIQSNLSQLYIDINNLILDSNYVTSQWALFPAVSALDMSGNGIDNTSYVSFYDDATNFRARYFLSNTYLTYDSGYEQRAVAQDWSSFTPERDLNMMSYSVTNATSIDTSIVNTDIIRGKGGNIQVQNNVTLLDNSIENIDYLRTNSVYFYRTAPDYSNMSYLSMHERSNIYYLSLDSTDFLSYNVVDGYYTFENGNQLNLYAASNAPSIVFQDSQSNVGTIQFDSSNFRISADMDVAYNNIRNINSVYITNLESTGDPVNVNAQLLCYGGLDLQVRNIENVSNINLYSVNGLPYVPGGGGGGGSNWYTYAAQGPVDFSGNDMNNVGTIYFNPYTSINQTNVDGVDYLNVNAPFHVWNYMIIFDTGGNNPGFRLQKNDGITATVTFDGFSINVDYPLFLQGRPLYGASEVDIVNTNTGNTAVLTYITQDYNDGETYEELAFQNVPFLFVNGLNQIELISVADIQFIDNATNEYNYLLCRNNEMFIENYNTDHVLVQEVPVASFWSKYPSQADVDFNGYGLDDVGHINYSNPGGIKASLPYTQFGDVTTDSATGEATVTFDVPFITDTYSVQVTYLESASTLPYVTVRKTGDFTFIAEPGKNVCWTATGYIS